MPADVEEEALVVDRARETADLLRVALNDRDGHLTARLLQQRIGRRQSGRPCADDYARLRRGGLNHALPAHAFMLTARARATNRRTPAPPRDEGQHAEQEQRADRDDRP